MSMRSWSTAKGLACSRNRGWRGTLRPGLRTVSYRKRAVVAFTADDTTETVTILGVFYGGQDCESALRDSDE